MENAGIRLGGIFDKQRRRNRPLNVCSVLVPLVADRLGAACQNA